MSDKLNMQTPDVVNENIDFIAAKFPNCITETAEGKAIDFDLLKQELNHEIVEGAKERYRLEWPGKKEAIVTANLPTTKTLRPVPEDSMRKDGTPYKKGESFYSSPLGKTDGASENMYIEGDNLEVLKILQESYLGKIKMIYIDPPYNTGKDFVYKDNFTQDSTEFKEETDQIDEYGNRLVANPETAGRYHSDWLSMMYPRLKLARNLLTEDGVIFMSIDDNEVDNLKKMASEIFGPQNFISQLIWKKKYIGGKHAKHYVDLHEYVLVFSKNIFGLDEVLMERPSGELAKFNLTDEYEKTRGKHYIRPLKSNLGLRKTLIYPIKMPDNKIINTQWMVSESTLKELEKEGRILYKEKRDGEYNIYRKYYAKDGGGKVKVPTLIEDVANADAKVEIKKLFNIIEGREIPFDNPKPTKLLSHLIQPIATENDDIILDFFSGSATTAHAVMQLNAEDGGNRKFIMIQLPEATDEKSEAYKAGYKNICEIGKERIRRAAAKIKEEVKAEIDYGFKVFKVDSSNMQDVYYKPQDYNQGQLDVFADNIKPERTAEDLLTQILLDWGLSLTLKTEKLSIQNKEVFKIAENSLMACFSEGVDEAFAKELAKHQPLRVVFKDSGFKNDTAKENVKQLLKQLSPNTEMKVI